MPSLSERIAANVRRYRKGQMKCPACGHLHRKCSACGDVHPIRLLSQGELADAAEITRAAVSEIESGKRQPTTATLEKLAKALMCKVQNLMD